MSCNQGWTLCHVIEWAGAVTREELTRFGYRVKFILRAGVRVFDATNMAGEPLFGMEFDIGVVALPHNGGQPNPEQVRGEGEGGEGEREGGEYEGGEVERKEV
ncbi:hypothetical protein EI94DRAFT_1708640 [Lactarius quietus]|nr:hypothetical protein EI94DRAFT_1708640 [Lactarius quietus]